MWDDTGAFDGRQLEQRLNQAAPSEPPPGGAVRFQLPLVLSALEESTGNQRYKQIFNKMRTTMDQLFPDGNLYLEAEALGGAAQAPDPALLEKVEDFLARVNEAARSAPAAATELGEIIAALLQDEPRQEADRVKGLSDLDRQLGGLENLVAKGSGASGGEAGIRLLGEALVQMLAMLAGLKGQANRQGEGPLGQCLPGRAAGPGPGGASPQATGPAPRPQRATGRPRPRSWTACWESLGF